MDANIRCLTNSNLEDCDHFYEYYDLVEDDGAATAPSYEFYDYVPPQNKELSEPGMGEERLKHALAEGKSACRCIHNFSLHNCTAIMLRCMSIMHVKDNATHNVASFTLWEVEKLLK